MKLADKLAAMPAVVSWDPRGGPQDSPDWKRIIGLPRRTLDGSRANVEALTGRLRRPGGTMSLLPIQAAALKDAEEVGGLVGFVGVGHGKTLLSLLLPVVWGARRSVLLVKSSLKAKLEALEYPELSKHWLLPPLEFDLRAEVRDGVTYVVSYSEFSRGQADALERIRPDAIVADEGHTFANTSARTRRFRRYFRLADPRPKLAVLSGSLADKSILDFASVTVLALGRGAPVPLEWSVLQQWALALDVSPFPGRPGVLTTLGDGATNPDSIRRGFRERLADTPGVVVTTDSPVDSELTIRRLPLDVPPAVEAALKKLRSEWALPDGELIDDALPLYAAERQLASGFYYKRTYPDCDEATVARWKAARLEWNRDVQNKVSRAIPGMDSPDLCWRAAKAGRWRVDSFEPWAAIKGTVKPKTEAVWISQFLIDAAIEWARVAPGLVWFEAAAMELALEAATSLGIPCYGAGKKSATSLIMEKGDRSVFVSMNAHREGNNLQAFTRSLILTVPGSNKWMEQVIGRTHRRGQSQAVTVDVFMHTPELERAWTNAVAKARFAEATTGNPQKLLSARLVGGLTIHESKCI